MRTSAAEIAALRDVAEKARKCAGFPIWGSDREALQRSLAVLDAVTSAAECGAAYEAGGVRTVCNLPAGHAGDDHEVICRGGEMLSCWPRKR